MVIGETIARYEHEPPLDIPQALHEFEGLSVAGLQIYENIGGEAKHRSAQRKAFLAGEITNPDLDLNNYTSDELEMMALDVHLTLDYINSGLCTSPEEKTAMMEIVMEKYAAVRFLQQAKLVYELPETDSSRQAEAEILQAMNDDIYEGPDRGLFNTLFSNLQGLAAEQQASDDAFVAQTAYELSALLGQTTGEAQPLFEPSQALLDHYGPIIREYFDELINYLDLDPDKIYQPEEMVTVFEQALEFIGAHDWKAVMKEGGTNRQTSQVSKEIRIGTESDPLSGGRLGLLAAHEVGVHVASRILGEASENPLLYYMGLVGAEPFEEGIVKVVEGVYGLRDDYKMEGHLLHSGLSLGLDGKPRDFRDLYEVAWRRNIVSQASEGVVITDEVIAKAQSDAYVATTRVKRGMPTDIPGMTFTKDAMYLQGYQQVWHFLDEQLLDDVQFAFMFMGKHQMIRADQRRIVAAAGPRNYNTDEKE